MGQTNSVGRILHVEIPPLDHTLEPFSFTCGLAVNQLSNLEMAWTQAVTQR